MKKNSDYLTLGLLMLTGMVGAAIGSEDLKAQVPALAWALLPVFNVGFGIALNQMRAMGAAPDVEPAS